MDISQGKVFYKPETGTYLSTIIDVVEKPQQQTQYGPKDKVLIEWALIDTLTGKTPIGPDGNPMFGSAYVTATINDKSSQPLFRNLYKILYGILGAPPPLITKFAELEALIMGRSNAIMLTKEPSDKKPGEFYSNVVAFMPFPANAPVPTAPANYKRRKDTPKQQQTPQGQVVATYSQPPAQPAAAPAAFTLPQYQAPTAPAAAPSAPATPAAPTADQIAAFLAAQQNKPSNTAF